MDEGKKYLTAEEFQQGSQKALAELDKEMGKDVCLIAFAPIRIISAGGFLAVTYLQNRESTGDIDYFIEPSLAGDKEIQGALREAVRKVARKLEFNRDWFNEAMAIFVTQKTRQALFEQAERQGIILFKGENLEILAAPIEWALERKLRRIYAGDRDRKAEIDMTDAVAILKELRTKNGGPLDLESVRTMNANGFDVLPDHRTMQQVADEYRRTYNEEIFK